MLTPLCVTYLLNVMVSIGDTLGNMGYTDGTITPIDNVERCITGRDVDLIDWVSIILLLIFQEYLHDIFYDLGQATNGI